MKKFLAFVGTFILLLSNAIAEEKTCHAGFFCVQNGKYINFNNAQQWFSNTGPAKLATSSDTLPAGYNLNDYDEVWICDMGKYYVKNGEVECRAPLGGILACPGTYPSSEPGASSVFQCFRTKSNGQKEYYKTPNNTQPSYDGNYNTDDVNTLLTTLQSALDQANTAAQNLESILKKSNNKINVKKLNINETISQTGDTATNTAQLQATTTITQSSGGTTTNNSNTTNNTNNTTTETNPNTTQPTSKKFDFGNLSSIFSTDKAAVHTQTAGRAAIPQKAPRTAITNNQTQPQRVATKPSNTRSGNSKSRLNK